MRVLLACEQSQTVCIEFRKLGHDAYSCDLEPSYGGHPEWHIQDTVLNHLGGWGMIIAFPPCTDLCGSGAAHFKRKIADGSQAKSIEFFLRFVHCNCPKIAIENPVGIMSTIYRKPDQIIQPWQFGHPDSKKTCLWLKNLTLLIPSKILPKPDCGYWDNQTPSGQNKLGPSKERSRLRSKTYQGIAKCMAEQWGGIE